MVKKPKPVIKSQGRMVFHILTDDELLRELPGRKPRVKERIRKSNAAKTGKPIKHTKDKD